MPIGTLVLLSGIVILLVVVAIWQWPNITRRFFSAQVDTGFTPKDAPTYQQVQIPDELTIEEKLMQVNPSQFVEELGQKSQVVGVVDLDEQMSKNRGVTWEPTGRNFRLIELTKKRLIAFLPQGDSGEETWFSFERTVAPKINTAFFGGTDDKPGPARQFDDSNQQGDVRFSALDKSWSMVGIPHYNFNGRGEAFATGSGTLRGVLAQEVDGPNWLFYVDVFEEKRGHDGLYIGQLMDPAVSIDDVL